VALEDDQPVTGVVPTPAPVATAAATLEAVVPMAGGKMRQIVNQGFPCASPTSIMHALLFTFVECVPYNADQAPDLDFTSLISKFLPAAIMLTFHHRFFLGLSALLS
jgi:hypothetical protein